MVDPETGSGAYMISGGLNGAIILIVLAIILFIICPPCVIIIVSALILALINGSLAAAVIIGLIIGVFLSQIIPQEIKEDIFNILTMALEISLPILEYMASAAVWYLALVVLLISAIVEGIKRLSAVDRRRLFLKLENVYVL